MQSGLGRSVFKLLSSLVECFAWTALHTPSDSADRPQGPLTIPAVHWHLAEHSQAGEDIVDESKTVLHDVNHGIGEDTDIEAFEEPSQAV